MIELESVSKRYDRLLAVDGVSLAVERGELLGLIGPNGAGKTSIMKMMATLATPDRGTVRLLGWPTQRAPGALRRRLGYMPAEFGRMPDMTVAEYLSYFGAACGVPRAVRRRRVEDVLDLVDLTARRDSLVGSGSTGIKQRTLIAKTLVHDPDVLILDEPAAGLDPRARVEVREVLKELRRIGKTIVVSSHILADMEEICDRVAILEHGRLVAHGSVAELTRDLARPSATAAWVVRVAPGTQDRAAEVLGGLEGVSSVALEEEGVRFATDAASANPALRALLAAEVEVVALRPEGPRLEDVFLQQTRGTIA